MQHLDGRLTPQSKVTSTVYRGHAALSQFLEDLVFVEDAADHGRKRLCERVEPQDESKVDSTSSGQKSQPHMQ